MTGPQDTLAMNSTPSPVPASRVRQSESVLLKRFDFGRVHGTLWQRVNGQGQKNLDLSICRRYLDGQGKFRESHSFSPQDLPCVRIIITAALRFLKMEQGVNAPLSSECRSGNQK